MVSSSLISNNAIPIIDMAYIRNREVWPIKSCTRQSALKLYKALTDQGLALLVNHGITEMKLQTAYHRLDYFCGLTENDKKKFEANLNSEDSGYYPAGPKTSGRLIDYKHTYNIKSKGRDSLPECFGGNNLNPLETVVDDFKSLAGTLLQFIAIGIGISPKFFKNIHDTCLTEDDESMLQLVYYPPTDDCVLCDEKRSEEKTENGMFVLIVQDSETGLEVLQGKKWVNAGYLPGAILMICGNLLKAWSEELCTPIPYRFTVPLDSNVRSRSRHCTLFASRLPPNTTELCPAMTPPLHAVGNMESLIMSLEDLADDNSNQNLSRLQRIFHYIRGTCKFPCKCTS